jgi:hypothetical protein
MFGAFLQNVYNILCEHLIKFEMISMNIEYPKKFVKQCDQCFHYFKKDLKHLKWFENDTFMKICLYIPL